MTLSNCYVTLEEISARLGGNVLAEQTSGLESAITSACRAIDDYCGQFFYDSGAATARTYRPRRVDRLKVDPFSTLTGLVIKTDTGNDGTYATTWASTDYEPDYFDDNPSNAYDTIGAIGAYRFPCYSLRRRTVQVTARWGWAAVPQNVVEAAKMVTLDLWRRKDAPFGSSTGGAHEFGALRLSKSALDQAVPLLASFMRTDRVAGLA